MTYLDQVSPTYLENWPASLCRLSIAQKDIPLTLAEARALGSNIMEFGEAFMPLTAEQEAQKAASFAWAKESMIAFARKEPQPPRIDPPKVEWVLSDISSIRERVKDAVAGFPDGAFVRLGSRSPKDTYERKRSEGLKVTAADADPLRFILGASERMYEDLNLALQYNYPPHIFVRQWLDFPPWAEFRCFQHAGRLVGVSQYNYRSHYPEINEYRSLITWGLDTFHARDFAPASHLDDVVFDVIAFVRSAGNERTIEIKLLEINPWGETTDPCLFDWRRGASDLDRTFRFVLPDKGEARYRI